VALCSFYYIALNWILKLWIETQISRRLAREDEQLWRRKIRAENHIQENFNIVRMNQPNIDEYVLTLLSCFYPWLFIPSYFWFLRAFYYDSRPILGQSCSRSCIFIAAAISRDTRTRIGNILFFPTWRRSFFRILHSLTNISNYYKQIIIL